MKKALKITGIAAVVLTLVFNLQYALLGYDIKNSPDKAMAAWTSNGTVFCFSSPSTTYRAGTWQWVSDDFYWDAYGYYGYEYGFWWFLPHNSGTECGLTEVFDHQPTNPASQGYNIPDYYYHLDPTRDITNIKPPYTP